MDCGGRHRGDGELASHHAQHHASPSDFVPSCLVVQHVEPERPYAIGDALAAAGVTVDLRRVFAGDPVPADASGFAGLVVMGGPMSARRDEGFPTRRAELDLLADAAGPRGAHPGGVSRGPAARPRRRGERCSRDRRSRGRLGSGRAHRRGRRRPPAGRPARSADRPALARRTPTTRRPVSVHLAASARYRGQAFRVGPRAWGLQFHLEVDDAAVAAFLDAFGRGRRQAGTTPEAIEAESPVGPGGPGAAPRPGPRPLRRPGAPARDRERERPGWLGSGYASAEQARVSGVLNLTTYVVSEATCP